MTDEFELMDELQLDVERIVNETIPFEPDAELREQTDHEEPVEGGQLSDGVDEQPADIELFADAPLLEEFDEL